MRVLTLGTFDLFHNGHKRLLERAATLGELTVAVNSDRFVTEYKGRPPMWEWADRAHDVSDYAEDVVENDGPGIDVIRHVGPDVIVIGHDWLGKDYPAQLGTTADELADLGVSVLFVPRTPGVSDRKSVV